MSDPIRETLFGDMPLAKWPFFAEARALVETHDTAGAIRAFQRVLATPELESRQYLQAWHELRRLGIHPEGKQLLGVVIEVAMDEGLDLLAAYADLSARYYNFSGAAVIWEHPDDSLDAHIHELFGAADAILQQIGPWEGERPPAPPQGQARISMLAPAGLFFGQAPLELLMGDALAGPAMLAATRLMQALIER